MTTQVTLKLEEIKKIELEILKKIDKICKDNNIQYTLMGGSAIGAVRHQGFIPWDDDIDIMMLREDFEKFRGIMKDINISNLKYFNCEDNLDYPYPFAKICDITTEAKETGIKQIKDYGVFVDIFPVDELPNDVNEREKYLSKLRKLRKIHLIKLYEKQISTKFSKLMLKRIIALFLKPMSLSKLTQKINSLMKKYYKSQNNPVYGLLYGTVTLEKKHFFTYDFIHNTQYVKFEDTEVKLMKKYDEYLTYTYGDYMKLPSEDECRSSHNWEILKYK